MPPVPTEINAVLKNVNKERKIDFTYFFFYHLFIFPSFPISFIISIFLAAKHCPGTESENAGEASACQGCPNRDFCRSRRGALADPDIELIGKRMNNIKHTVIVLSGKGGVGKSTFSAQLAFALAAHKSASEETREENRETDPDFDDFADENENDWQVGLMDIDICGPSIPTMLGIEKESLHQTSSGMTPAYVSDNLAAISVGFLLDDADEAVVWRGPRKNGIIKQFLRDVDWGEDGLDWLVVDTPPGTSDEHLSVARYLKPYVDGAIIVTSPQDVALADVRKEIGFCRKTGINIIGVVENMSGFICPCCHVK